MRSNGLAVEAMSQNPDGPECGFFLSAATGRRLSASSTLNYWVVVLRQCCNTYAWLVTSDSICPETHLPLGQISHGSPLWPIKKLTFIIVKKWENFLYPLFAWALVASWLLAPPFLELLNTPLHVTVQSWVISSLCSISGDDELSSS